MAPPSTSFYPLPVGKSMPGVSLGTPRLLHFYVLGPNTGVPFTGLVPIGVAVV